MYTGIYPNYTYGISFNYSNNYFTVERTTNGGDTWTVLKKV